MKKPIFHIFSIFAIASFLFMALGSDDFDKSEDSSSSSSLAYSYAEEFVKERLKSPYSAKFPGVFEKREHVTKLSNDEYLIDSYVDSQNLFGAMIRSEFSCKIIFKGDRVRCEDLLIK